MLRNARVQRQSPTSELCLLGRNHIQKGSLLSGFPIQTSIDLFAKFSINELRLVPFKSSKYSFSSAGYAFMTRDAHLGTYVKVLAFFVGNARVGFYRPIRGAS